MKSHNFLFFMRKTALFFGGFWIFTIPQEGYARFCPNPPTEDVRQVSLSDLRPTQYGMSQETVTRNIRELQKGGKPFLQGLRERYIKTPLPVILGPTSNGNGLVYYVEDNHHLVVAAVQGLKQGLITEGKREPAEESAKNDELRDYEDDICVRVKSDQKHLSWSEFAQHLAQQETGLLFPEDRQGVELSLAYSKVLSRSFSEMVDVPMRGHVGWVFNTLDLGGKFFLPFIELKVAERVQDSILKSEKTQWPSEDFSSDKWRLSVFKEIFGANIRPFLESQLRPGLEEPYAKRAKDALERGDRFFRQVMDGGEYAQETEQRQLELLDQLRQPGR